MKNVQLHSFLPSFILQSFDPTIVWSYICYGPLPKKRHYTMKNVQLHSFLPVCYTGSGVGMRPN
jgi:hypothetical protein